MEISNQKSGDNSTNLQAGGDIILNSEKIVFYSMEEVAKQLMDSVFGELPEGTKKQIKTNQRSYFQALSENLGKIIKQNEDLKKVIDSPDFQYISKTASISASRSSSIELHKNLSSLIIQRINNDDEDLKRIVYNEAISTIGKLTADQLKIITLCYLLSYTSVGIESWEAYQNYLNSCIKPFLGFKNTNAEFQHIEYTGCGSIRFGSWSLVDIYKQQYSFLFLNLIEKAKIEDINLPEEIKSELLRLDTTEDKYFVRTKNKNELEKYLKNKNLEEQKLNKLVSLYERSIKDSNEVKKKIEEETEVGKILLELWEKSNISYLSLTSVGIIIAISYFEQTVGQKIDIEVWIN